jgi:hypothetical protein
MWRQRENQPIGGGESYLHRRSGENHYEEMKTMKEMTKISA